MEHQLLGFLPILLRALKSNFRFSGEELSSNDPLLSNHNTSTTTTKKKGKKKMQLRIEANQINMNINLYATLGKKLCGAQCISDLLGTNSD